MTEKEASNTRCCGPEGCGAVGNPDYAGGPSSRWCIGPVCMAWRWEVKVDVWIIVKVRINSSTDGFCGLAGKP